MRKKLILITILFLFITLLSFSNEKLVNENFVSDKVPAMNTSVNSINPAYDELLKEYKMKKENIVVLSNYIQESINKKGSATIYSKFEKDALIVSDEKNNLLFSEKISKNLSKIATYFKSKQIYQLKDGRIFVSSDYILENNEDKSRTVSETLLKKSINLKNVFDFIDLTGDLNDSSDIILTIAKERTSATMPNYAGSSLEFTKNNLKQIVGVKEANIEIVEVSSAPEGTSEGSVVDQIPKPDEKFDLKRTRVKISIYKPKTHQTSQNRSR